MKYLIDYGYGKATLYTPNKNWESRFYALAYTCFGIRKSIAYAKLIESSTDYEIKKYEDEYERLEFNGDCYIWRKDGARKMIEPSTDGEWDTYYCEECHS